MRTLLASLALALMVLTPKPLVRWPATDATKVVQGADVCLACLLVPGHVVTPRDHQGDVHPNGSQRV